MAQEITVNLIFRIKTSFAQQHSKEAPVEVSKLVGNFNTNEILKFDRCPIPKWFLGIVQSKWQIQDSKWKCLGMTHFWQPAVL